MVDVVQLVRASDCGSECRGFDSSTQDKPCKIYFLQGFLLYYHINSCYMTYLQLKYRLRKSLLRENTINDYLITFTSPFLAILTILEGW